MRKLFVPIIAMTIAVTSAIATEVTSISFGSGASRAGNRNAAFGVGAGNGSSSGSSDTVNLGYNAGAGGSGVSRVCIGSYAGATNTENGVIAIGANAGINSSLANAVLIGANENCVWDDSGPSPCLVPDIYSGNGIVSINGKQLYINQSNDEFAICPTRNWESITNAPLYYKNGVIYLNGAIQYKNTTAVYSNGMEITSFPVMKQYVDSNLQDPAVIRALESSEYDLFMAPYGNDNYPGTAVAPKASFEGCLAALNSANKKTGAKIGVLPGFYTPITNPSSGTDDYLYTPEGGVCADFIAIAGKDRTIIRGLYTNTNGFNDGFIHSMAFASGHQKFKGFSFVNISGFAGEESPSEGYLTAYAPAFSKVTLDDCHILCSKPIHYSATYSAFNDCIITNSIIEDAYLVCDAGNGNSAVFSNCDIVDSLIRVKNWASSGALYMHFFGNNVTASASAFDLPVQTTALTLSDPTGCSYINCTFRRLASGNAEFDEDRLAGLFPQTQASNCYFCVANASVATDQRDNVITSYADAYLNENLVPNSVQCPAVRSVFQRDAGWKDSGLGLAKSLMDVLSRL